MSQRLLAAVLVAALDPSWHAIAATHPAAALSGKALVISASVELPSPCYEATIVPRSARNSYEVLVRLKPQDVHMMCATVIVPEIVHATFVVRTAPSAIWLRAADRVFRVTVRRGT